MARGDLTDAQYERLQPLLPSSDGKPGHPYEDHRRILNGILWIDRTGAPWRDLPERYGPWQTCYDRLVRWRRAGVWERVLQTLQGEADAAGDLDWEVVSVDSTVVRAHQHAAGARHTPAAAEAAVAEAAVGAQKGGTTERAPTKHWDEAVAGSRPSCISPLTGGVARSRST
jgi:transposase